MFGVLGGSPYYDLDEDMNILKTYNPSLTELVETYFSVEPSVSLNYKVLDNMSLKAIVSQHRTSKQYATPERQCLSTVM